MMTIFSSYGKIGVRKFQGGGLLWQKKRKNLYINR